MVALMPGNIRMVQWSTRDGKRRRIRLYSVWLNLRGRVGGGNSNQPWLWANVRNEFYSWERFREWALRTGYRKGMQLDRINPYKDYAPDNCQWLTAEEHGRKSLASHQLGCPCATCRLRRTKTLQAIPMPVVAIDPEVGF